QRGPARAAEPRVSLVLGPARRADRAHAAVILRATRGTWQASRGGRSWARPPVDTHPQTGYAWSNPASIGGAWGELPEGGPAGSPRPGGARDRGDRDRGAEGAPTHQGRPAGRHLGPTGPGRARDTA